MNEKQCRKWENIINQNSHIVITPPNFRNDEENFRKVGKEQRAEAYTVNWMFGIWKLEVKIGVWSPGSTEDHELIPREGF